MQYLRGRRALSSRARYAVPLAIMAAIAAGAVAPTLSGAASPPTLPSATPAQLLADMAQAKVPALTGALSWTTNLGLSDLSTIQSELGQSSQNSGTGTGSSALSGGTLAGIDLLSLLSGNYQLDVWLGGAQAEHLALSQSDAQETDLVRNGNQVWIWDSTTSTVTHLVFEPPGGAGAAEAASASSSGAPALTPQQLADRFLDHISPVMTASVGTPLFVAGVPAYRLTFTPNAAPGTTLSRVEVDLGASPSLFGVALAVAVYAVGQPTPAISLGFTGSLDVAQPPATELTFTPPPGSQVVTHVVTGHAFHLASGAGGGAGGKLSLAKSGKGWDSVVSGTDQQLANELNDPQYSALTSVVSAGGQQARLLGTDLLNVLVMPDGHFYAGFVTPGVLEAAASSAS